MNDAPPYAGALPTTLRFDPRLNSYAVFEERRSELERLIKGYLWKRNLESSFPLIVCLTGGTGTGKSTLFNSLAGRIISNVGMRRPCTHTPVVYVHEHAKDQFLRCPFLDLNKTAGPSVNSNEIMVSSHNDLQAMGVILVDTPDFDSVESANRSVADDFFVVGDIMMFVTSQEKYGDLAGDQVLRRGRDWGKKAIVVMNKVASDAALADFRARLEADGAVDNPIRVERMESPPELIEGLRERPGFSDIFRIGAGDPLGKRIRSDELDRLRVQTLRRLEDLDAALAAETDRISSAAERIDAILGQAVIEMESSLDQVLSQDVQSHVHDRLQDLLKKYDIFRAPRTLIRTALQKAFGLIASLIFPGSDEQDKDLRDKRMRADDIDATRSVARLKPLEMAAARLNQEIATFLTSDPALSDLCLAARSDAPRWSDQELRERFDKAFPGVESLLEAEFKRFREGLSVTDEVQLYGAYATWTLLLVTAEIVLGGGLGYLDMVLDAVVVPLIPKWLLNFKVMELLKEIGGRVDTEYRRILKQILTAQADLHKAALMGLLPGEDARNQFKSIGAGLQTPLALS
jgi:energy-coupling factor transporter ATP-binding protein EcfA2